jgi:hypothetical protein
MKQVIILFCCAVLFSACVRNNPKPIWLKIDHWTLQSNGSDANLGMLTHNLSEAWVYVDNKVIGVFELPCKIPVLASGNKKIQIYPAIRNNGIAATKKIYPFCKPMEFNLDLVEGQTYEIDAVTEYYEGLQCWKEDFTANTFAIETIEPSNTVLMLGNDPDISISPNNQYGRIHFTTSDSLWLAHTIDNLDLPSSQEVYLEIDYRNTNNLLTGVLALTNSGAEENPYILLNAQDPSTVRWKKIYIDLQEIISYSTSANAFQIYFNTLIDSGKTESDIYLDNIKVVYF